MTNNENMVFDDKSGISVEEQKEILSTINGIAEKNRQSLTQGDSGEGGKIPAQKSGAIFPLAVNVAAAFVLAAGALLLISFNGRTDAQVKTGNAVFTITERALIDEIRKDTAEKIAAKELEISSIASRLEDVDAQLGLLFSDDENLTPEQIAARNRLLGLQGLYRDELVLLQDEKSQILENSRSREAGIRAQLDERARETAEERTGEQDSAMNELERLSGEREKIAAVDAQISGGLALVNDLLKKGQYEEAHHTIESLRFFCNNNSISASRAFQSRREFYNQSFNLMEGMIADAREYGASGTGGREQSDLLAKNTQLEGTIAEMQKTIESFTSGSSGQARRIGELEENITTLRSSVSSLEANVSEKDRTISSLETEKNTLTQNNADLNRTLTNLQDSYITMEQELTNIRNTLRSLMDN